MGAFLESVILPEKFNYGASVTQKDAVDKTGSSDGTEVRRLRHPYVQKSFDVSYDINSSEAIEIMALYYRANGSYRGFRVVDPLDFSTKDYVGVPTYYDQFLLPTASSSVYQMLRIYGYTDALAGFQDAESARRIIAKPYGTPLVGCYSVVAQTYSQVNSVHYTIDMATGKVTFVAGSAGIASVTHGASTVVTTNTAHNFVVGNWVKATISAWSTTVYARVSAVGGSTSFTLDYDSSAKSDLGSVATNFSISFTDATKCMPTFGSYFHIPCRFDSAPQQTFANYGTVRVSSVKLLELLNP